MKRILWAIALMAILASCSKEEDPVVTSITLDKTELELKVGDVYNFKVTHTPPEAKTPTYKWLVSRYFPLYGDREGINIATIDENGKLTAMKEGTTTVIVTTIDVFDPVSNSPLKHACKVTIKPVEAEGIVIDKSEVTLKGGESITLSAKIQPDNTTNAKVYWTSSNSKIVSIEKDQVFDGKIKVTALAEGEATITASVSNNSSITATCKITVSPTDLEGLSLNEKEKTVLQGESFKLNPIFTPEYATNKNVKWSSSDDNIATVDNDGNVKTFNFGECSIKAVAEDGGFEAVCKVIVKPTPLENIKFNEYSYNVEIGGTRQLKVTYIPENAGNKKIKWSSSNSIVATIDQNGVVKGNTQGYTTITATSEDGEHVATCDIYVVEINKMMQVYFPSSSVTIINGFYTGMISCAIRNNSSQSVKITKFRVIDTNTFLTVAETTDESLLGTELAPGQTIALSGRFNSVYEPSFIWEMEYNGRQFQTYNRYGDSSFMSTEIKSASYSNVMVPLRRLK